MARSYIRSRRRTKNGILVREAAVARGVPTNSLFSVPITGTVATNGNAVWFNSTTQAGSRLNVGDRGANVSALPGSLVRASSVTVASQSPFLVKVLNSSGGYTTYEIKGQIPTKINLSRETSVFGNAALFKAFDKGSVATPSVALIAIDRAENAVDIKLNVVVDSGLDD